MPLTFVTWADRTPSGGNTYNRELVAALRARGEAVDVVAVDGAWPDPTPADLDRLAAALRGRTAVLADGIVACAAPEVLAAAARDGVAITVLVHMPLAEEVGVPPPVAARRRADEDAALAAAAAVLSPSRHTARALAARGIAATVAAPGVRPAPVATGSLGRGREASFLVLGALSPTKDPLTAIRALADVRDRPWRAALVGPGEPGYVREVQWAVDDAGLAARVRLTGPLEGDALEELWQRTDLLLLPSRWETYGMVVTEALARGVPALVAAGTGAVEALGAGTPGDELPGAALPPGEPRAWADAVRRWLTDADLRRRWRTAALVARDRLPTWDATADVVLAALRGA